MKLLLGRPPCCHKCGRPTRRSSNARLCWDCAQQLTAHHGSDCDMSVAALMANEECRLLWPEECQ